jgi:hypothetical protein
METKMAKKSNVPEVLGPIDSAPNVRAQLEAFIEHKMAEMMGGDAGVFEPFFQPKKIADEIRKLQTVPQQRKWHDYFEEWGCLICEKKNRPHTSNGMCNACRRRTAGRLQAILRFTEKQERPDAPSFAPNRLTELARGAVRMQLSAETPPLETRPYVTKAERTVHREKAVKATHDRITACRAETLHQAKALRFEEGLTWREVTQRLDPTGLANDPERAIQRLRLAVHHYFPPAVRKTGQAKIAQRQQERSASRKEIWRQARALHVEQKLTWREIAQRLDPDFDKNPKAAIARIEMGAHRVSPVRDLTELARAAVRRLSKKNSAS